MGDNSSRVDRHVRVKARYDAHDTLGAPPSERALWRDVLVYVEEIVGMICTKFEEEGVRNFAIGKRANEHAQWQKGNFPGYTGSDFDTLMRRIQADVRMFVPIKADSIQVADWVKAHVLRELVRSAHGDVADQLSCHEYIRLTGKALSFDKKNVEGSLVEGWLDTIVEIGCVRQRGVRVSSEDFLTRLSENGKRLEALKAPADKKVSADLTAKADTVMFCLSKGLGAPIGSMLVGSAELMDRARIYRNVVPDRGHWLLIRAVDPALGGRDAYGAEVRVRAGERSWLRLINPGSSFLSSNDVRAHVGLGAAGRVDEIKVRWPDGTTETFKWDRLDLAVADRTTRPCEAQHHGAVALLLRRITAARLEDSQGPHMVLQGRKLGFRLGYAASYRT